jgi:surface protein
MAYMFHQATAFNNGGNSSISNWVTNSVTNVAYMFRGAKSFNQNIRSWNTSAVKDMRSMF